MSVNFTNEYVMNKIQLLSKTYWFASDIQAYLDCSKVKAVKIKDIVASTKGTILINEEEVKKAVRTDDVIKCLGGNGRLEEIEILQKTMEILGRLN